MKAGRELDALVAKKVMGFCRYRLQQGSFDRDDLWGECENANHWFGLPCYSKDIAAAWQVVEKVLNNRLFDFDLSTSDGSESWRAFFRMHAPVVAFADTAPLAICLAALKAKGVEV